MALSFSVTFPNFRKQLSRQEREVIKLLRDASRIGLTQTARWARSKIHKEIRQVTPRDTGALRRSIRTRRIIKGEQPNVVTEYTQRYAYVLLARGAIPLEPLNLDRRYFSQFQLEFANALVQLQRRSD